MVYEHVTKCSSSLALRKMQIKTTMSLPTPIRTVKAILLYLNYGGDKISVQTHTHMNESIGNTREI